MWKLRVSAIYRGTLSISEAEYKFIGTLQHSEPPSLDLLTVKYLLFLHLLIRCSSHVFSKGFLWKPFNPVNLPLSCNKPNKFNTFYSQLV